MNIDKIAYRIAKDIKELPLLEEAYEKISKADSDIQSMANNIKEQIRQLSPKERKIKAELIKAIKLIDGSSSDLLKTVRALRNSIDIWERKK